MTRMFNFGTKHWSEGIFTALGNHIASHLEFGGCLADYRGLLSRYNQLRAFEDVDDLQALSGTSSNGSRTRIRFLNYYTLSPGRPKPPSTAKGSRDTSQVDLSAEPMSEDKIEGEINDKLADVIVPAKSDDGERSQATASLSQSKTPVTDDDDDDDDDDRSEASTIFFESKEEEDVGNAGLITMQEESGQPLDLNRLSMQELDPVPMDETEYGIVEQDLEIAAPSIPHSSSASIEDTMDEKKDELSASIEDTIDEKKDSSEKALVSPSLDLPPIPDLPSPPEQPDLSQYTDKDSRKQAEKEFGRLQKAYENATKDRNRAVREREKLIEKLQKKAQKDAQKDTDKLEKDIKKQQQKDAEKLEKDLKKQQQKAEQEQKRLEKEEEKAARAEKKRLEKEAAAAAKQQLADETKRAASLAAASSSSIASIGSPETEAETPAAGGKPKKLGKFCTTPRKTNGVMDPTWVSVYMDGMDEVTAHCGLFFPGPHYDKLVSDVGGRIVGWVRDDLSTRAMLAMD
jgi:hypothetical protein